jgi:hypothetical protein
LKVNPGKKPEFGLTISACEGKSAFFKKSPISFHVETVIES